MPDRSTASEAHFEHLEQRLVGGGIRPRDARRLVAEMRDHHEDVVSELLADGLAHADARREAFDRLGSPEIIAEGALQFDELKSWWRRFPRAALVVYPLACAAVLPAVPVIAGVRHRALIGRWISCLAGGALVTGTMLFALSVATIL